MSGNEPRNSEVSIDDLLGAVPERRGDAFATAFRGYDRDEVDHAFGSFAARQRADAQRVTELELQHRQSLADATRAAQQLRTLEADVESGAQRIQELEAELKVARAQVSKAEKHVRTLTGELADGAARGDGDRSRFEEVLRVAEEQAALIIKNATVQGERLIVAVNEDVAKRKAEAKADADAVVSRAHHDEQQVRLRVATELTAHEALLEQQLAHAAERVAQADQEAATVRTEAERGAAALRALVTRETEQQRAQAEEAVRELRLRALEFDESLTRRQDEAQQEFLMLHNQAVAHAERITRDANDQVAASIDHAQRVSAKAADFDRLMRAQASQIEAEAHSRAGEILEHARTKAQRIIDTVTGHSQSVLRDAEDRARVLRWQGQQLSSFMAEVHELVRPDGLGDVDEDGGELDASAGPDADVEDADVEDADEMDETERPLDDVSAPTASGDAGEARPDAEGEAGPDAEGVAGPDAEGVVGPDAEGVVLSKPRSVVRRATSTTVKATAAAPRTRPAD